MPLKVLGLSSSPRAESNSTRLLREALNGARDGGAAVEEIALSERRIGPCRACDACRNSGRCVYDDDDFLKILDEMLAAERIIVASPVYFMGAPAQLKLLVDRTQCLYNKKYVLRKRSPKEERERRRGALIASCGSRLENAFDGLDLTVRYFFDSLECDFTEKLYVRRTDRRGSVESRPEVIEKARELGLRMAEDKGPS